MKRKITLSQVEYYKGSYSQCDATLGHWTMYGYVFDCHDWGKGTVTGI